MNYQILIIDDNLDEIKLTKAAIKSAGLNAVATIDFMTDPELALDGLRKNSCDQPYHIILTDLKMPKISGLEIVSELRGMPSFQETPIVLLTHSGLEQDIDNAVNAGVTCFIQKPSDLDQLIALYRCIARSLEVFGKFIPANMLHDYTGPIFYPRRVADTGNSYKMVKEQFVIIRQVQTTEDLTKSA